MALAPTPVMAFGPAESGKPAAAPTEVGGSVALLRFTGPDPSGSIRDTAQEEFTDKGFRIKNVALDARAAAKKVKCRGGEMNDSCLKALGKWLNKSKKTASDYIVFGSVEEDGGGKRANITVYDVAKNVKVKDYSSTLIEGDFIGPIMLPRAVASDLAEHVVPALPATEEETQILAELDEPAKTAEEIAEEQRKIAEAEDAAGQVGVEDVDTSGIVYHLKADFKDYCREGNRKKRESKEEALDPRPSCKRGPFWGYWQPRAWAFLTATLVSAAAMGGLYGVALARRGPYTDAIDAVESFERRVGGDPTQDPYSACDSDGVCYADLASEASKTGAQMRSMAIAGDALLGVTVLLAGVLGIIIVQDRKYASDKLTDEKRIDIISGVRLSPLVGRTSGGGALGFRF